MARPTDLPVGISIFPHDTTRAPRAWAERYFGIAPVRWTPITLLREVFAYAQDPSPVFT